MLKDVFVILNDIIRTVIATVKTTVILILNESLIICRVIILRMNFIEKYVNDLRQSKRLLLLSSSIRIGLENIEICNFSKDYSLGYNQYWMHCSKVFNINLNFYRELFANKFIISSNVIVMIFKAKLITLLCIFNYLNP